MTKVSLNKRVFNYLKASTETEEPKFKGRAFHSGGATTSSARSPFVFSRACGTTRKWPNGYVWVKQVGDVPSCLTMQGSICENCDGSNDRKSWSFLGMSETVAQGK